MSSVCDQNWYKEALSDALEMVDYFEDDIVEQLKDGAASNNLYNDYPNGDEHHHESHVDKGYTLLEAAHLLSQLNDYDDDDRGLWEGIEDPERAIEIRAAYAYGNAVISLWQDYIKELNEAFEEVDAVPRGPKEWRPGKEKSSQSIKAWFKEWIKKEREKLVGA